MDLSENDLYAAKNPPNHKVIFSEFMRSTTHGFFWVAYFQTHSFFLKKIQQDEHFLPLQWQGFCLEEKHHRNSGHLGTDCLVKKMLTELIRLTKYQLSWIILINMFELILNNPQLYLLIINYPEYWRFFQSSRFDIKNYYFQKRSYFHTDVKTWSLKSWLIFLELRKFISKWSLYDATNTYFKR